MLKLVAEGFSSREIAEQIYIGVKTVETYRARFAEKLGLKSRADLVRYALEVGLLSPERFSVAEKRKKNRLNRPEDRSIAHEYSLDHPELRCSRRHLEYSVLPAKPAAAAGNFAEHSAARTPHHAQSGRMVRSYFRGRGRTQRGASPLATARRSAFRWPARIIYYFGIAAAWKNSKVSRNRSSAATTTRPSTISTTSNGLMSLSNSTRS